MNIAFLIFAPGITGGNVVIFEHATRLFEYGHGVTMITKNSLSENKQELFWYKDAQSLNWLTYEEVNNQKLVFYSSKFSPNINKRSRKKIRRFIFFRIRT